MTMCCGVNFEIFENSYEIKMKKVGKKLGKLLEF